MFNQVANTFEDLTGVSTSSFSNPYDALIAACEDDPVSCFCILYSHLLSTFCRRGFKKSMSCIAPQGTSSKRRRCSMPTFKAST